MISDKLAKYIYTLAQNELMAHTIRAVQSYIFWLRKKKGFNDNGAVYAIIINEFYPLADKTEDKIENCVLYGAQKATIQLDVTLNHNEKRRIIAHELAHILLAAHAVSENPDFYTFKRENVTPQQCSNFENKICDLHDTFYRDRNNWSKLFFQPPFEIDNSR